MAARYIPPGRRNTGEAHGQQPTHVTKKTSSGRHEPANDVYPRSYSAGDIYNYFGNGRDNSQHNISTLHPSAAHPDSLAFVLLFPGANPRWASDNILFVKSNLDLIRTSTEDSSDEVEAAGKLPEAVAIFEQTHHSLSAKFVFIGWYKVTHVHFISPRSPDLVRMLAQKWTKRDRDGNVSQIERQGESWTRSLNLHWAVVKFEKDEAAEKEKGTLDIPQKSVSELLQEMRVHDSVPAGAKGAISSSGSQSVKPLTEKDLNLATGSIQASAAKEVLTAEIVEGQEGSISKADVADNS
jgi:hypothetical protein